MVEVKDGGPAFPCEGGANSGLHADPGMTLRDWFAGQALAGMNAVLVETSVWPDDFVARHMARSAYVQADALIAARGGQ